MKKENLRLVEVRQNSFEEENLLLLTSLNDEQIKKVLVPLREEERNDDEGLIIYANDDMAQILSDAYPKEVVIYYQEPDYLEI